MNKTKTTSAADNTAAEAPDTTSVEQTNPTVEQTEQAPEQQSEDLNTVVVMCYRGTVDVMKKIWKKQLPEGVNLIFLEADPTEEMSLTVTLVNLLSDSGIPKGFIFVPANVIPCSYVDLAGLMLPVVYVKKSGARVYKSNLPMFIDKDNLVDTIDELEKSGQFAKATDNDADELLVKTYLESCAARAVEVSHNFGNYVTLVARANPCIHTVIEGFLRKKFISVTDPAGFAAITPELIKAYNLDSDNE